MWGMIAPTQEVLRGTFSSGHHLERPSLLDTRHRIPLGVALGGGLERPVPKRLRHRV